VSLVSKSISSDGSPAGPEPGVFEAGVWRRVGAVWKQLFGGFKDVGFSFEWHEFTTDSTFKWGDSFHPGSVEICLNLKGTGSVQVGDRVAEFAPLTAGFYRQARTPLTAYRNSRQTHRFITLEFSPQFLAEHLKEFSSALHPLVHDAVTRKSEDSGVGPAQRLTSDQQRLIQTLREPPVLLSAQKLWYQCKALELASVFLFQPPQTDEMFCARHHRLSRQRVEKVIEILRADLCHPPALEDLGRKVGCSPFYLSRTFSREMGMTLPQYLRQLRMERAEELLRSGKYNVTETAMEVGYSSLGHFSQAFHETYGCCPGLYPIAPHHLSAASKTK
jgi:AraC family transcriptional regulator